jgi:DNA-binding response OmpR family regulator
MAEKVTGTRVKLLVVEDHPHMQTFMADFCEVNGYDADFAANGSDALRLIDKAMPYSVIVVDFLMPRMHGVEFVKQARKKWGNVPIIAMSGFDDVEQPFLDAGARTFLQKPFDPYQLEAEIAMIVRGAAA